MSDPSPIFETVHKWVDTPLDIIEDKDLGNTGPHYWTIHTSIQWNTSSMSSIKWDNQYRHYFGDRFDYIIAPVHIFDPEPYKPAHDRRYMKKMARKCVDKMGHCPNHIRKAAIKCEMNHVQHNHNNLKFWCGFPSGTLEYHVIDEHWSLSYGSNDD